MTSELIIPSRCTANLPDDFLDHHVAETKMDGSRYVMYLGAEVDPYNRQKRNALLSRRVSTVDEKHVDKTANVPHLLDVDYPDFAGTVLDGECFHIDFPTTQSIMGSGPAKAIAKQKEVGRISYHAWDCTVFRGIDIRGKPLSERRRILEHVINAIGNPYLVAIEQRPASVANEWFVHITENGGEGLIIKDLRMGYGISWAKMKKSYDVSAFISGYKPGNGKYSKSVGSIALSVFDGKEIVEIGFASGFDDAVREQINSNREKFLGQVVDVYAQEISKDGRLRHPTFYRFRDDLNQSDCTKQRVIDALKTKAKSKRKRGFE